MQSWMKVFEKYSSGLHTNTIFVGHSLGPAFILRILEKYGKKIDACFFVAGFIQRLGIAQFDKRNRSFIEGKFDWKKITSLCKSFTVINSANDPYVPLQCGEKLAKNLGVKITVLENAGHINKDAGYTHFEFLFEEIKKRL